MASLVGWRVVKAKYAATAFTGEGARLYAGRWNSAGIRVVYCSENLALAALEILVHLRGVALRDKLRAFSVTFESALMVSLDAKKLRSDWNAEPPIAASKKIGDEWVRSSRSAILAVPSVLVPLEHTYLLNPAHPEFGKIKIKSIGDFRLDPRLKA